MEKQKIFLFLIAAGAIFILLQQSSQVPTIHNVHNHFIVNSSNSSSLKSTNNNSTDESKWLYDKFIGQLSKTLGSSDSSRNHLNSKYSSSKKLSPDEQKQKDHQRSIRHKYNFIDKFKIFKNNEQSKVLILAYFRSGSSFIGDMIQQNWKSFYTFEPLHYMTRQLRIDDKNLTEATNLINSIYNCDFSDNISQYNTWIRNHTFLIRWNRFFWNICKFRTMSICYDNEFMSDVCRRSRYNIVKTVRLRLGDIEQLMEKMNETNNLNNLKIIYLVRDPRGIYNSRKSMEWCNTDECTNLTNICNDIRSDLNDFDRLKQKYGNNLILLRYEDITTNTKNETKKLFKNINIEYSQYIERFLHTHTTNYSHHNYHSSLHTNKDKDKKNPYSTYRSNSTLTALQWTKQLNTTELEYANQVCNDIIERLNYDKIILPNIIIDDSDSVTSTQTTITAINNDSTNDHSIHSNIEHIENS